MPYSRNNPVENLLVRIAERALTAVLKAEISQNLTSQPGLSLSLPKPRPDLNYTLYVHIPFCESLCPYCSFNRFLYESHKACGYFKALREEMHFIAKKGYDFKTLYIGGGTPTINLDELITTIDLARELFSIQEVSCETNPNHLIPEYVTRLKDRVQRLSVGVQSFDTDLLREMNRLEKFGSGSEILERIRYAAPFFESLNVDMIFNFPNQNIEILNRDLDAVISSGAQQVTFYPLMSSNSVKKSMAASVGKPTHHREWAFFNLINDRLEQEFTQLSAWTFVRKTTGMIDEYIAGGDEYVGIGSGAFSYLDGALYVNEFSVNRYMEAITSGKTALTAINHYNLKAQMRYWFMMNLFSMNFNYGAFVSKFHAPLWRSLWIEMLFMTLTGAFQQEDHGKLTRRGQYLSVVMMREFFSGVNNIRDIARKNLGPLELASAMPEKK